MFQRPEFLEEIAKASKGKSIQVKMPKSLMIQEIKICGNDIIERKNQIGLKYPVICKTQVASATDNSHILAIALNDEGLKEIAENAIYQYYFH